MAGAHRESGGILVSQPGLSGGVRQQVVTVGATAVPCPAVPLVGRAAVLLRNVGSTTIYLGKSTVTADEAATGGWQLAAGEQTVLLPLNEATVLYAISSGAGGLVSVLELAA